MVSLSQPYSNFSRLDIFISSPPVRLEVSLSINVVVGASIVELNCSISEVERGVPPVKGCSSVVGIEVEVSFIKMFCSSFVKGVPPVKVSEDIVSPILY